MIKLVVADLDGTIFKNGLISNQTKDTIKKLRQAGIVFTIATGRHITTAKQTAQELGINGPIVCNNGALVIDPNTNQRYDYLLIEEEKVHQAIQIAEDFQVPYLLYTMNDTISTNNSKQLLLDIVGDNVNDIHEVKQSDLKDIIASGILKILMVEYDKQKQEHLRKTLEAKGLHKIVQSHVGFLDMINPNTNKGHGVAFLASYYKVNKEEILTIGDQENDLEMIRFTPNGVAMKDANPLLIREASYVTKSYEEEGFTEAVMDLVFHNRNK
jgi:Cof subfamily protein (haloacid dehalogenase superfamily)